MRMWVGLYRSCTMRISCCILPTHTHLRPPPRPPSPQVLRNPQELPGPHLTLHQPAERQASRNDPGPGSAAQRVAETPGGGEKEGEPAFPCSPPRSPLSHLLSLPAASLDPLPAPLLPLLPLTVPAGHQRDCGQDAARAQRAAAHPGRQDCGHRGTAGAGKRGGKTHGLYVPGWISCPPPSNEGPVSSSPFRLRLRAVRRRPSADLGSPTPHPFRLRLRAVRRRPSA